MAHGAARRYHARMATPPKCPTCGTAITRPQLIKIGVVNMAGSMWMSDEKPIAVGVQCENAQCGALLPLTVYKEPPARRV